MKRSRHALALRSFLLTAALGLILPARLFSAAPAAPIPPKAPYDIETMRRMVNAQYQQGLADLRKKGKPTTQDLVELDGLNKEYAAKLDQVRQQQLDEIYRSANKGKPSEIVHTGTPPGDLSYRPVRGDMDILTDDMVLFAAKARAKGYTVTYGPGYVKVDELDVVAWPAKDWPTSLDDQVERLFDKEIAKGKTVTNQIKKNIQNLEIDPLKLSDAGLEKWVQEMGKAADKAGDVTGVRKSFDEHSLMKEGRRPQGVLWDIDATDAEKAAAVKAYKEKVESRLKESFKESQINGEREYQELQAKADRARQAGNPNDSAKYEKEISARRLDEAQTKEALYRKHPEKMYELTHDVKLIEIIDHETGARSFRDQQSGQKISGDQVADAVQGARQEASTLRQKRSGGTALPDAPKGKSFLPAGFSEKLGTGLDVASNLYEFYAAFQQEAAEAAAGKHKFSWTTVGLTTVGNISGFIQAYEAGEKLDKATGEDTLKFIAEQRKQLVKEGKNPDDLYYKLQIGMLAIARGTAYGTWEGSKALPIIGGAINGLSNINDLALTGMEWYYEKDAMVQEQEANKSYQTMTQLRAMEVLQRDTAVFLRMQAQYQSNQKPLLERIKRLEQIIGDIPSPAALANSLADARRAYDNQLGRLKAETPAAGNIPEDIAGIRRALSSLQDSLDALNDKILGTLSQYSGSKIADKNVLKNTLIPSYQNECAGYAATLEGLRSVITGSGQNAEELGNLSDRYQDLVRLQAQVAGVKDLSPQLDNETAKMKASLDYLQRSRDSLLRGFKFFGQSASPADKAILDRLQSQVANAVIDDRRVKQHEEQSKAVRSMAAKFAGIKTAPVPAPRLSDLRPSKPIPGIETLGPRHSLATGTLDQVRKNIEKLKALVPKRDDEDNATSRGDRVRINPAKTQAKIQDTLTFSAIVADPPTPVEVYWSFGDNSPTIKVSHLNPVSHRYDREGQYGVSLSVTRWDKGNTSEYTEAPLPPRWVSVGNASSTVTIIKDPTDGKHNALPGLPDAKTAADIDRINAWRTQCLDQLNPDNDPVRAANRDAALAAANAIHAHGERFVCRNCNVEVAHWWTNPNQWQCPRCELCTFITDQRRPDGQTYGEFAQARIRLLQEQRQKVNADADALIAKLRNQR